MKIRMKEETTEREVGLTNKEKTNVNKETQYFSGYSLEKLKEEKRKLEAVKMRIFYDIPEEKPDENKRKL